MKDGCRDIRAAADGFSKDHVWRMFKQLIHYLNQPRESAAETSAGNFSVLKPAQRNVFRIDQSFALIVEYDGASQTAPFQLLRCSQEEGSFSGAKKAANQNYTWLFGRVICYHARTSIEVSASDKITWRPELIRAPRSGSRPSRPGAGFRRMSRPFVLGAFSPDSAPAFRRFPPWPKCRTRQSHRNGRQEFLRGPSQ